MRLKAQDEISGLQHVEVHLFVGYFADLPFSPSNAFHKHYVQH